MTEVEEEADETSISKAGEEAAAMVGEGEEQEKALTVARDRRTAMSERT